MKSLWVVVVVAAVASLFLWPLLRPLIDRPALRRKNYRSEELLGVSGIALVVLALLGVLAVFAVDLDASVSSEGTATIAVLVGFGVLGFIDDIGARSSGGGFGGHLRAVIVDGQFTTGLLKLFGGAAVGIIAVAVADVGAEGESSAAMVVRVLRGGALVALGANLLNLFDRAPARATKVGAIWWVVLVLAAWSAGAEGSETHAVWAAAVVGVSLGMAPTEVRERHMLGDTGVNALGAAVGLSTALVAGSNAQWWVLAALVVVNLASERLSFTSIIDQTALLRWFDRIGSRYRS